MQEEPFSSVVARKYLDVCASMLYNLHNAYHALFKEVMTDIGSIWGLPGWRSIELDAAATIICFAENGERARLEVHLFAVRPFVLYVPIEEIVEHLYTARDRSKFDEYLRRTDDELRLRYGEWLILPFAEDANSGTTAGNFLCCCNTYNDGLCWGVRRCRPGVGSADAIGEVIAARLWSLMLLPVNDGCRAALSHNERRRNYPFHYWVKTPHSFIEHLYQAYEEDVDGKTGEYSRFRLYAGGMSE